MKTSVIISTYNNPESLFKVIRGVEQQSVDDFEIVIADDGSDDRTVELINEIKRSSSRHIQHIFQENKGFRKSRILNKAILASTGEYIIFLDGDCIPVKDMIKTHLQHARTDRYIAGSEIRLSQKMTDELTAEDVQNGFFEQFGWWWFHVKKTRRLIIWKIPGLRRLFDRNVKIPPSWRGGNASTYKSNILKVGGFDERFTYGYEDGDFGQRLECAGVHGYSIRYSAPTFHLEHGRPYRRPEDKKNIQYYNENRECNMTLTPYGIQESVDSATPP